MSEGTNLNDIRITGAGRVNSGKYKSVHVAGSGWIGGDTEVAEDVSISGSATMEGALSAKLLKVSGTASIKGDLKCGDASVSGSVSVDGDAELSGEMRSAGGMKIKGRLKANAIRSSGLITCGGDAECESFEARGAFKIKGLLNAEQIDCEIDGECEAQEIGGTSVVVREKLQGFSILKLLNLRGDGKLTVDTIEANKIELEVTKANVVRGHDVKIGIGCDIERVEYTGSIDISASATVREVVEVTP